MRVYVHQTIMIDGLVWRPGIYDMEDGYWLQRLLAAGAVPSHGGIDVEMHAASSGEQPRRRRGPRAAEQSAEDES